MNGLLNHFRIAHSDCYCFFLTNILVRRCWFLSNDLEAKQMDFGGMIHGMPKSTHYPLTFSMSSITGIISVWNSLIISMASL